MTDLERTRECTAYHESAHAVIFTVLGIEVEHVNLDRMGFGSCKVSDDLAPSRERLLGLLAGREADKLFLSNRPDELTLREDGWAEDMRMAHEVYSQLSPNYSLEHASEDAAKLVKEYWHKIEKLAKRMLEKSEEDFRDVREYWMSTGDI